MKQNIAPFIHPQNNKNYAIKKGVINVQNINDNECFKWRLVRHFILQMIIQE